MARKPKYRRHSTRDLGFAEYSGKRHYFPGPCGSRESLAGYQSLLASAGFFSLPHSPAALTIADLADRFIAWAEATYGIGQRCYSANLQDAVKLLGMFTDNGPVESFSPLRVKAFQKWLIERKLSRKYINSVVGSIRLMFKWGVSEEVVPVAVYQAMLTVQGLKRGRSGAVEKPKRKPVEWKHVEATLAKLNPTVRRMVQVHWLTGVRSHSLCSARVEDFDCSTDPWEWQPLHKTQHLGHSLVVFVGPKAQKLLAPLFRDRKPDDYLFRPANKLGKRSKRYRSFYDPTTYARAVKRAAIKAGVPHWSPHQLRHARGTLVREKHGLEAAQAALGHARIDATQIYAQKHLALAKRVAETMG